jgi:hypothetical protein
VGDPGCIPGGASSFQETDSPSGEVTTFAVPPKKGCHVADRYVRYLGANGSTSLRWHHVVEFCWDGKKVTKIPQRYHYLSNVTTNVETKGVTRDSQSGKGTATYTSFMQGELRLLAPWWGNTLRIVHPHSRMIMKGNGTYTIEHGG